MNFKETGCCGIQELTALSHHTLPEDAMRVFCVTILGNIRKVTYADRVLGDFNTKGNHLYSFYLFTAAVYESGTGSQRPYGHNFAAFIKGHGLGVVSTIPATPNHAFHPDHKVQAWLWKPSLRGLKKWYQAELDREAAEIAAKLAAANTEAAAPVPAKAPAPRPALAAQQKALALQMQAQRAGAGQPQEQLDPF